MQKGCFYCLYCYKKLFKWCFYAFHAENNRSSLRFHNDIFILTLCQDFKSFPDTMLFSAYRQKLALLCKHRAHALPAATINIGNLYIIRIPPQTPRRQLGGITLITLITRPVGATITCFSVRISVVITS